MHIFSRYSNKCFGSENYRNLTKLQRVTNFLDKVTEIDNKYFYETFEIIYNDGSTTNKCCGVDLNTCSFISLWGEKLKEFCTICKVRKLLKGEGSEKNEMVLDDDIDKLAILTNIKVYMFQDVSGYKKIVIPMGEKESNNIVFIYSSGSHFSGLKIN